MSVISFKREALRCCPNGFLEDYLKYTSYLETPRDFNRWVGISALASALGRNVWVRKGDMLLYPNLYIVLIGPSAIGKGIAIGAGRELLISSIGKNLSVCAQKITTEGLIQFLVKTYEKLKKSETFICVPEFATFIGRCKNDPSLLHTLTHYYDSLEKDTYTTVGRGEETIEKICINMLAGSTPEWIKNSLPEDAIGGGFLSRLILVNRNERVPRRAFHEFSANELLCKTNCREDLQQIRTLQGEFSWDSMAMDYFSEWYCNHLDDERENADANMEGYYGRKAAFVQKLSMISSAMYSDNKTICYEDLQFAFTMLKENERHAEKVIKNMAQSESGRMVAKVSAIIRQAKTISRSDLVHKVQYQLNSDKLNEILITLAEGGDIVVDNSTRKIEYKWVSEMEKLKKEERRLKLMKAGTITIEGV